MTKDEAKKLSYILKAYSEGKIIEVSNNGSQWAELNMSYPDTVFKYNQHRIKPEPKLVPFTFEDNLMFRDKWIRSKSNKFPGMLKIISYNEVNVHTEFSAIGYKYLLDEYVFDGAEPCGKLINE